jgi:hypothetical protein
VPTPRFLAAYRRRSVICHRLLPIVLAEAEFCATLGESERRLTVHVELVLARPAVRHLIWTGALLADLGRPLETGTRVSRSGAVSRWTLALAPGVRLLVDGDVVEVLVLEGMRVMLRNVRTGGLQTVGLTVLISTAGPRLALDRVVMHALRCRP